MVNILWPGPKPSLAELSMELGLALEALDATFGVVATAPGDNVYTVLIDEAALDDLAARPSVSVVWTPFSTSQLKAEK